MTKENDREQMLRDQLDEVYEHPVIAGITFSPSRILEELDPIAFRCAVADMEDEEDEDEEDEDEEDEDEEYELSDNQKLFVREANRQHFDVDMDYSGRGMYGKSCPAVRVGRDDSSPHFTANVKEDSMGMGYVVYAQY